MSNNRALKESGIRSNGWFRPKPLTAALLLTFLLCFLPSTGAKKLAKVKAGLNYKEGQEVGIIVNSVGPFNNPIEKYRFYSLPFCDTHDTHGNKGGEKHKQRLREAMAGDRRESSPYVVHYGQNVDNSVVCRKTLTKDDIKAFKEAIENYYFFEMYVEDIPMAGFIGDVQNEDTIGRDLGLAFSGPMTSYGGTYTLFTHLNFQLGMNNGKIVSASVTTDTSKTTDITNDESKDVQFSYSVTWVEEKIAWKNRMKHLQNNSLVPKSLEIHWLSIVNSSVLVILLTFLLLIIFNRILKNDLSNYMDLELNEDVMEEEETGWKMISGDVFRFPNHSLLFCACVGTGTQLLVTVMTVLSLALTGFVSTTRRGSILTCFVITYCLTSIIGGYISTKLYFQMNGKAWARCVFLAALLFPLPVAIVFAWANSVAMAHGSISALPFTTIVTIGFLYAFVSLPLTLFGGLFAKQYAKKDMEAPVRTTKVAREIPSELPFYTNRFFRMVLAGNLPFTAIYVELHYVFKCMWGHQLYTMFGVLFCAFVLVLIVTSFITVALLYFQLSREDHRWWWATFFNAGMGGVYLYLYSFYFYFYESGMTGFLQTSFYFGYMAIISFAMFLILGSTGFRLSLMFVKYIYSRVKCD